MVRTLAAKFPEHRVRGMGTWYEVRHYKKTVERQGYTASFRPLNYGNAYQLERNAAGDVVASQSRVEFCPIG